MPSSSYYDALGRALGGYSNSGGLGQALSGLGSGGAEANFGPALAALVQTGTAGGSVWSELMNRLGNSMNSTQNDRSSLMSNLISQENTNTEQRQALVNQLLSQGTNPSGSEVRVRNTAGNIVTGQYGDELAALRSRMEGERTAERGASDARYNELVGGGTGYNQRMNDMTAMHEGVATGYQDRQNQLGAMFDTRSNQGATDIAAGYSALGAKADQNMRNRGLGNTTVRSNVQSGIGGQGQAALARYGDQRVNEKIDLMKGLWGDTLGAKGKTADVKTLLSGDRLRAIENRNVNYSSLGDLLNSLTLGAADQEQRFALPGYASQTRFGY